MPFAPKPLNALTPESLHLRIRREADKNGYRATRSRNRPGWRIADRFTGTILAGREFDLDDQAALAFIHYIAPDAAISVTLIGLEDQ